MVILQMPRDKQAPPLDIGENTKMLRLWNAVDLHLSSVLARDSQQPLIEDLLLHPCENLFLHFE